MLENLIEMALDALLILVAVLSVGFFVYLMETKILSKRFLQGAGFLLLFVAAFGSIAYLQMMPKPKPNLGMQKLENAGHARTANTISLKPKSS